MRQNPDIKHQFFYFAAPLFAALLIIFLIFYYVSKATHIENIKKDDKFFTELVNHNISLLLTQSASDLFYLSGLNEFTAPLTIQSKNDISHQFIGMLSARAPFYSQARLVDLNGIEIVAVNYQEEQAVEIKQSDLLDISDTYYFADIQSLNVSSGDIYLSPMDLQIKDGVPERPVKPIIRLSIPIFDELERHTGYIILTYNAQLLINEFRLMSSMAGNHLYLINETGYWLINPQTVKEFSFMFEGRYRFSDEYQQEWIFMSERNHDQIKTKAGIFTYRGVSMPNLPGFATNQRDWKILALTTQQTIEDGLAKVIGNLAIIAAILTLLMAFVSWLLARSRVQRIVEHQDYLDTERLNRSIVQSSANAIVAMDSVGIIIDCNPAALTLFKRTIDDIKGFKFERTFITVKHHQNFLNFISDISKLVPGSHSQTMDFEAFNTDGDSIPISLVLSVDEIKDSKILTAFIQDNTETVKAQELQRLTEVVFNSTTEGITVTDANNNIEIINPAFSQITGYSELEIIGKNPRILRSGKHSNEFYEDMWNQLHYHGIWHGEIWNRKKTGEIYPEEISLALVRDKQGEVKHHIAIFHDISKRKSREERIAYQAHYDQLTGLPNRFVFIDNLNREINSFKRYEDQFALLFIDLDDFKQINDNFGHRTGDLVLQEAAKRLLESVRESDMVARLAGDEFTIIIRSIDQKQDLSRIVAKVKAGLEGEFTVGNNKLAISGSIGGIIYHADYGSADDLLHAADEAMYESKQSDKPDS